MIAMDGIVKTALVTNRTSGVWSSFVDPEIDFRHIAEFQKI
jgi:hypothetical protein